MTRPGELHRLEATLRRMQRRIRQIVTANRKRRRRIKALRDQAPPRFGIDFAWGRPHPAALRAAGVTFVCRYLSPDPSKNLTRAEALAYAKAGIDVLVIWESTAGRALEGKLAGEADARAALSALRALGLGTHPIYFAIDTDARGVAVSGYFEGACHVLGRAGVGAYGGINPVSYLFDVGLIGYGWQTYAWSNGLWDHRAQLQQYSNDHTIDGVSVDWDRSTAVDFGQWRAA